MGCIKSCKKCEIYHRDYLHWPNGGRQLGWLYLNSERLVLLAFSRFCCKWSKFLDFPLAATSCILPESAPFLCWFDSPCLLFQWTNLALMNDLTQKNLKILTSDFLRYFETAVKNAVWKSWMKTNCKAANRSSTCPIFGDGIKHLMRKN